MRPVAQVAHDLQISAQVIHTWRGQRLIDIGQLPGAISRGPFPSYFRISNTIFTARSRSSLWYFRCADMTLHRSRDQSLPGAGQATSWYTGWLYRLMLATPPRRRPTHDATPQARSSPWRRSHLFRPTHAKSVGLTS